MGSVSNYRQIDRTPNGSQMMGAGRCIGKIEERVMSEVILDVREFDEFNAEHVDGSINVPLSCFGCMAPGVLKALQDREILLLCLGGARAKMAEQQLDQMGFASKLKTRVFEGGLKEWKKQGKATVVRKAQHLPIMRQVQLVVGPMVLIGTILGAFVNPGFLIVSGFVGAGLTVAGATGFCGMAKLLSLMPWNKA